MKDLPFVDDVEVVDEEGEILTVPQGADLLAHVAQLGLEASEQARQWEARRKRFSAELVERQESHSAVYGEVSVSLQHGTFIDRTRLRNAIEDMALEDDELYELLFAATQFNSEQLSPRLKSLIRRSQAPGRSYARFSRVRKLAPVEDSNGTA